MNRSFNIFAAIAAVVCGFTVVSCSEEKEPEQEVVNHIYLQVPDGNSTIVAGTNETIEVQVSLSQPVKESTSFNFALEGANTSVFSLSGNPVTIAAGSAQGFFTVSAASDAQITEDVTATFSIAGLDPKKFDISTNLTIKMIPGQSSGDLDPEIAALVNAWKSKYGVDLAPWIGNVKLSGTIEFPGGGYLTPFIAPTTINLNGYTKFAISSEATEDMPALDMVENPMGMTEYLYTSLRQLTVEDYEFFALEDMGNGLELMELIDWNADSNESFSASLPGIKLTNISNGKATLEFVAEGENLILDSKGEPVTTEIWEDGVTYNNATSWIPFDYDFTAWQRQLGLVEAGNEEATQLLEYFVTAAPATYLGIYDVLEDYFEDEDDIINYYVYPSGEIDFNAGTITFVFPFIHADQWGYSRVQVVYTLN